MDYAALLYDPIYATFGVPATLMSSRSGATGVTVTVIERRERVDAAGEFELGTLRPGAFVLRRTLDGAGITPAELDGGTLSLGGQTWRIEAHTPRPGPDGEASGEVLMHLVEESGLA